MINNRCVNNVMAYCVEPSPKARLKLHYGSGKGGYDGIGDCPANFNKCPHIRTFTETLPDLTLLTEGAAHRKATKRSKKKKTE